MSRTLDRCGEIERSLLRKYRKELWAPFVTAVKRYELIAPGDRICVCISGGKDSMLMAKLFQQLHRVTEVPFSLAFLVLDPGYSEKNLQRIRDNAEVMRIPIEIRQANIFSVADRAEKNPCYLCARMRRGFLYRYAQEMGCNKIALGHHFNDVIETTVMAMFYASKLEGMMPKVRSRNFPGMELIRPMYRIRERDIIAFARYNRLEFLACACRFTEEGREKEGLSKRREIKNLIAELQKTNPDIEISIFNALHAVCVDTFPGWKRKNLPHSFLEWYGQPAGGEELTETEE